MTIYLFPWSYKVWAGAFPIFNWWRFNISIWKMGRGNGNFWLPNVSLSYINWNNLKPPSL